MALLLSIPVEILVQILQDCEDLAEVIALASSCKRFHSAWTANSGVIIWPWAKRSIVACDDALMAIKGNTRKVSVVLFGVFQVEEITMPADIEDITKGYLLARPVIIGIKDIRRVIDKLCEFGRGIYNPRDRRHEPPRPFYQLFSFTPRKYLSVDFAKAAFEDRWELAEPAACKSLADPRIFCEGEAGHCLYDTYPMSDSEDN